MRKLNTLVCLGIIMGSLMLPGSSQAAATTGLAAGVLESPLGFDDCGGISVQSANAAFEAELVALVNRERANRGLPPLKRVTQLDQAARAHAEDMGEEKYMAHDSKSPNCSWSDRINKYYSGWNSLSENIASGHGDPEGVMAGWMNSEGHRNNILSTGNCEIGVGYYPDGLYGTSWVQDFGCRQMTNVYPLIINLEETITSNHSVSLYVYGSWSEIRLKNDNEAWSAWQPFQNSLTWHLPDQSGAHTVSAEMRKSGASASSSDTIQLNLPIAVDYTDFLYLPLISYQ